MGNNSLDNPRVLVYLAAPYSHPDESVRESRFLIINAEASHLMRDRGLRIFSPISHSHSIAVAGGLPGDWDFWESFDRAILNVCFKMIVLTLPGWQESKGVTAEIALAKEMGIPIEYLAPSAKPVKK